jgi:hypothetical protein
MPPPVSASPAAVITRPIVPPAAAMVIAKFGFAG